MDLSLKLARDLHLPVEEALRMAEEARDRVVSFTLLSPAEKVKMTSSSPQMRAVADKREWGTLPRRL